MKKEYKVRHIVFDIDQFLRLAEEIEEDELVILLGDREIKWIAERYTASICIRSRMRYEPEFIQLLEKEIPSYYSSRAEIALKALRKALGLTITEKKEYVEF